MAGAARPSDLPTRFVASLVMIAVALGATYFGGWPFRVLVAAAAAVMLVEWSDIQRSPRLWAYLGAGLLAALLLLGSQYLIPVGAANGTRPEATGEKVASFFSANWLGFAAVALFGLILGALSRRLAMFGGTIYVGIPALALIALGWVDEILVFWVFIVTWATDILAYFAGRSIGGPKLAPRISPNKTWAGLIGGAVGAGVLGGLAAWYFELGPLFVWIGAPMGVIAQLGDLYESWVKRRAGVKDSGSILPGHGGVLDRLDGLLAVVVATTLLLMLGNWPA